MAISAFATTFRAFKHRNYRLFFSTQFLSLIGTWMQTAAQAWLAYRLTDSAFLLGVVAFAGQVPVFILGPLAGAIADRHSKRRILLFTQVSGLVLASTLAVLTLTGTVHVVHIVALASLLGISSAFDVPARQAFMIELVGKQDLINAIALNSSMVNAARIVGPALAGIVVAKAGEGWCFALNGLSFVATIVGLSRMQLKPHRRPSRQAVLAHMLEGFRFVRATRPVAALLLLLGVNSLFGMPYAVLMPVFAREILHGGPRALGLLLAMSGAGALAGALLLAMRRGTRGLGTWIAISAVGFGASLIAFAASSSFWLSAAILVGVGFFMIVQMAASNTLIQVMVPDELRGRVMAFYSMMLLGMAPFGALFAGALASHLGAPVTVAVAGVSCVLAAAVFALRLPGLRREARRFIVAQAAAGGEPPQDTTAEVPRLRS